MKTLNLSIVVLLIFSGRLMAQTKPDLSEKMAKTVMTIWKDSVEMERKGRPASWSYFTGVVMEGMINIWRRTGKDEYFNYVQHNMDRFISETGAIKGYRREYYDLDQLKNGRILLALYKETKSEKYRKAAMLLRDQLRDHPRTKEGGFWHQRIYPHQMWLDGLYMAEPFYTEYSATFNERANFDDIANQFILMEKYARDPKSGLLYHGWDEAKQQKWADRSTGLSASFWGRSMGWFGMALVDVLEYFPENHPKRPEIVGILKRFSEAITKVQDRSTGVWYQVLDKPTGKGNYTEASASSMFVYTLAKGVRLGCLPSKYKRVARKGFEGTIKEFVEIDATGLVNLNRTVVVAGLSDTRNGTYEYYLSERVKTNDPKGVGAFLLASNEMAR
jgi:unsaturated rhamnogalacturonyl hydrolase